MNTPFLESRSRTTRTSPIWSISQCLWLTHGSISCTSACSISPNNSGQLVKDAPLFSPVIVVDGQFHGEQVLCRDCRFNRQVSHTSPPSFQRIQGLNGNFRSLVRRSYQPPPSLIDIIAVHRVVIHRLNMAFPSGLPQPIRCFNGVFTFLGVGVHGFDVPSIGGLFQPASPLIGGAAFKGVAVDGGNMTFVGGLLRTKKPTWWNSRRRSATSAYSSTSLPTGTGCSSSSHPTTIHCKAQNGECNRRLTKIPSIG